MNLNLMKNKQIINKIRIFPRLYLCTHTKRNAYFYPVESLDILGNS